MAQHNVLWIMADQFNADCLSAAGHPYVRTPAIDALAEQGVRFENTYCQYPQCVPSRMSYMLSQYCRTHRQYGFRGLTPAARENIFTYYKNRGYQTGAFGKFHTHPIAPYLPLDRCNPCLYEDWWMATDGEHYGAYLERHGLSFPTHETAGGPRPKPPRPEAFYIANIPLEHNLEKWTADRTIDFINDCSRDDQPFFSWMTFERPHKPINVPREVWGRVDWRQIELARPETAEQLLAKPRITLLGREDVCSDTWRTPEDFRKLLAAYFTLIELIDDNIGRVIDTLRANGQLENTHIIFCADHGDLAGSKRIFDKCLHASSDQLNRVPFIIRPADDCIKEQAVRGRVIAEPIETIDMLPTLCALDDVEPLPGAEGRDLSTVFTGGSLPADRTVFTESYYRRAVVKNGWKYVHHVGCENHELYHIAEDPHEYDNLYRVAGHAQIIDDLRHELIRFLSEPFGETESRWIDEVLLADTGNFDKYFDNPLHRRGGEKEPTMVEGAGIHQLRYKHHDLYYRIDNRRHLLFHWQSDPQHKTNLYGTHKGSIFYVEMVNVLINMLARRISYRTLWEPHPVGAELPNVAEVENYLSQPLMQE